MLGEVLELLYAEQILLTDHSSSMSQLHLACV